MCVQKADDGSNRWAFHHGDNWKVGKKNLSTLRGTMAWIWGYPISLQNRYFLSSLTCCSSHFLRDKRKWVEANWGKENQAVADKQGCAKHVKVSFLMRSFQWLDESRSSHSTPCAVSEPSKVSCLSFFIWGSVGMLMLNSFAAISKNTHKKKS